MPAMVASRLRQPLGLALGLALVLSLQTVRLGFFLDDFKLLAHAEGVYPQNRALDFFSFARDPVEFQRLVQQGPFPWWSLPTLKLAFFRPLSSALMQLDSTVFGRAAWAFHLHSVLWFLALVLAAAAFYRRALPNGAGRLALFLFVLDDVHCIPVAWISQRNSLVAAVPAILGLVAYLRWREEGWKPGQFLAPVGVAIGLLGGESTLAFVGYFVSWELFSTRPTRERLEALVPLFSVLLLWACLYRALGYGAYGSEIYIDPGAAPLEFLKVAPGRFLALLSAMTFKLPSELWNAIARARPALMGAGLLGAALVAGVARNFWPVLEERERLAVKWLSAGALFSLVPVLATFPSSRLLLPATLGSLGVLGVLLQAAWKRKTRGGRAVVAWLALVTGVLPVGGWIATPIILDRFNRASTSAILEGPSERFDRPVVLLNSGNLVPAVYGQLFLLQANRPYPDRWWPLTLDPNAHRVRRVGERALEIETVGGRMLDTLFERLVRGDRFPFEAGDSVALAGARVTVVTVDRGKPTRIRVDFELPLSEHRFLRWKADTFVEVQPPLQGEVLELEALPNPLEIRL